jgi:O-antigen/teichoic acid export membrane protein
VSVPPTTEGSADPPMPTVRHRVISGIRWTLVGYGAQNVLRFASNLMLTRLLQPTAFGLMTLTNIFIMGLELLSDVGVGPAIIQSKRGDDHRLLDTAWTVQIVRGFILFGVSLVIAWPASKYYSSAQLGPLIVAAGVGIVIRGFTPTRVHSLNRKVLLGRLTLMEFSSQIIALTVTLLLSWKLRSVWGLLIGTLVGDVARVVLSFAVLPGHRHRLLFDRDALKEIVHIGRWIILSTAVTYAAANLDRLVMGRLLSVREVGIYSIAFQIVSSVTGLGRMFGSRVIFPVLAETARLSKENLYLRLRKARVLWILPTVAVLVILSIWGDVLIRHLYKADYQAAGWMLRILAAGAIVATVNQATGVVWPSLGDFKVISILMVVQVPILLTFMYIGRLTFGVVGFVVGAAAVEIPILPLQSFLVQRRHKLWQPEVDLPILAIGAALVTLGFLLR